MRSCEEYLDWIMRSIDGETTPQEETELQTHMASCARCRSLYQCYQAVDQGILQLDEEPPKQLHTAIMRSIHQDQVRYHPKTWLHRGRFTILAAAAAVVLLLVGKFGPELSFSSSQSSTSSAAEAVAAEDNTGNAATPEMAAEFRSGDTAGTQEAPEAAPEVPEAASDDATSDNAAIIGGKTEADTVLDGSDEAALRQQLKAAGCSGTVYVTNGMDDDKLTEILTGTDYATAELESGTTVYGVQPQFLQQLLDDGTISVTNTLQLDDSTDMAWILPG